MAAPDRSLPVAVFDSGVGGLTVLHECLVSLPHEDFLYLGDTARFPYGDRSADELLGFARELAGILLERGAKLLVVACNSATAAALPALREELEGRLPVVGVVTPESRLAAAATVNGRVGLIATPATVASGAYARALAEAAPEAELHAVASAELAPLIQEGGEVDSRVVSCVEGLCRPLRQAGVDTVILGCTHYPLVRPVLQRALGRGVSIVSSGEAIASEVDVRLHDAGVAQDADRRGSYRFLATGRSRRVPPARDSIPSAAHRCRGARGRGAGREERRMSGPRNDGRSPAELREVVITPGFVRSATGSALIEAGGTRVICTASVDESVPRWMAGKGRGWVTAEYSMLPASTGERKQRDVSRGRPDGRTVEIQRLIGRSLRGIVDFEALGERTVWVDCDVLEADGGTRCLAITGGYVALELALRRVMAEGKLAAMPLTQSVAAVSAGMVDGRALLDLDYSEDSTAEVDANVVMTGDGGLVEVQATAERTPLSRASLDDLLALAADGITELRAAQEQAVAAAAAG